VVIDSAAGANAAGAAADVSTSTLLQWFALNTRDPAARSLLYKDVPKRYTWNSRLKEWRLRKYMGCKKVALMHGVSSQNVELFMLRRLLLPTTKKTNYYSSWSGSQKHACLSIGAACNEKDKGCIRFSRSPRLSIKRRS
jgi:hypothetical protein